MGSAWCTCGGAPVLHHVHAPPHVDHALPVGGDLRILNPFEVEDVHSREGLSNGHRRSGEHEQKKESDFAGHETRRVGRKNARRPLHVPIYG